MNFIFFLLFPNNVCVAFLVDPSLPQEIQVMTAAISMKFAKVAFIEVIRPPKYDNFLVKLKTLKTNPIFCLLDKLS